MSRVPCIISATISSFALPLSFAGDQNSPEGIEPVLALLVPLTPWLKLVPPIVRKLITSRTLLSVVVVPL
jgi:hypothetical protein